VHIEGEEDAKNEQNIQDNQMNSQLCMNLSRIKQRQKKVDRVWIQQQDMAE